MNSVATREIWSSALAFPMADVLVRYQKKTGTSDKLAQLHERELKRYLYLCALHPGGGWPMVITIDDLWHTFIIFTKEYHQFCQALGVPYLHHQPFVDGNDVNLTELNERYQQFRLLYRQEFGRMPSQVWPRKLSTECADGDSCESSCSQCR